ncbi:hypothetical protein [Dactylosporangium salmoneum]|uniref:Uncharacterized protein n=1 Tax=Dactylosporangium salmoneum TaxID=53361 RepID=A0ABN3GA88_9ACTN
MLEWEPKIGERVVDGRRDSRGAAGVVIDCARYGHFAGPYWRASVRWGAGYVEHNIETSWLDRDETKETTR